MEEGAYKGSEHRSSEKGPKTSRLDLLRLLGFSRPFFFSKRAKRIRASFLLQPVSLSRYEDFRLDYLRDLERQRQIKFHQTKRQQRKAEKNLLESDNYP